MTADAYLASLASDYESSSRHSHLFKSSSSVTSKWCATKVSLHTGKGLFFVCLEQQILLRGKEVYPAKRYRLRVGSPEVSPIVSNDLSNLVAPMRKYLDKFGDFLPMPAQAIMSSLFSGENITPVKNIQEEQ